eukprot:scaffold613_cov79-Phaeocystis_antarctica.AAC.4
MCWSSAIIRSCGLGLRLGLGTIRSSVRPRSSSADRSAAPVQGEANTLGVGPCVAYAAHTARGSGAASPRGRRSSPCLAPRTEHSWARAWPTGPHSPQACSELLEGLPRPPPVHPATKGST